MEIKCIGCGAILQTEDENKVGYVNKEVMAKKNLEDLYCKRCFQLKHYNIYSPIIHNVKTIERINSDSFSKVFLVIDCFLLDSQLNFLFKKLKNKEISIIFTKFDCFKDLVKRNNFKKYVLELAKKNKQKIASIFFNDEISLFLKELSKLKGNSYFVGYTNSGKSSFINKLMKTLFMTNKDYITTSKNVGTTIDFIEIKVNDRLTIIDTPGFNYSNLYNINSIITNKVKTRTYQANELQTYVIDNNFAVIKEKSNVSFYISNDLKITRCKFENLNKHIEVNIIKSIILKENFYYDIEIEAIGFFRILGPCSLKIAAKGDFKYYVRKSII